MTPPCLYLSKNQKGYASDRKKGHTTIPRDHCNETEHETHFFLLSTKCILKTKNVVSQNMHVGHNDF